MLAAERKTCKEKHFAWSPAFSKAVESKSFWKILLSLKRNHLRPSERIKCWARSFEVEDIAALSTSEINSNLRKAQRKLQEIKSKAAELRENYLAELLAISQEDRDDKQHAKRLQILIRAHRRQFAYKKLQFILKQNIRGGLSSVLVPEGSEPNEYPYEVEKVKSWTPVYDHKRLQDFIQQRNINHFGQAHGTPFTIPPLNALDWGAQGHHADQILAGKIPEDLDSEDQYVKAILKYIATREQLPEIDTYQSPEEISRGYRRWKELTSTSPSGCHLGLRRIPAFPTESKETEAIQSRIQIVQAHIINIPTMIGFSPKRWGKVINTMLEKIPGKPFLHKLRVIHILEADYNLTLKNIFGRRLMQNCERHGTLGELQDGFRKGRSTTRTLLHNEIICDYNKRLRIDNFIGMTDISACFDRILPSLIALLNRRNGCPKSAVAMHADTLKASKYFLKTQNGVSETWYSNETNPVYGNGQGAGDSPSQWSQESAMMFDLYQGLVDGTTISNRQGAIMAKIPLTAFADDTNLLGNNDDRSKSKEDMINEVERAFRHWNGLLHATGHSMEIGKCASYISFWEFQDDGFAYTILPEEHGQEIKIQNIHGQEETIPQLKANEAQRLLGVMKCPIGDQQAEIQRLKSKSDQYATRINSNALTRIEAKLAYEVFYIPALRYSLNITSINQMDMETIQSKATIAFLSAQGYNQKMPREVVYAPQIYQGIGMRHLYDLQGSDSTRLLLQELNQEKSMTQNLLLALLEVIQLEAGIGKPILEDCRPLEYLEWGWIPQIRDFLYHIDGKILHATKTPELYREHDQYLMDSPYLDRKTRREKLYIHRCRLYLQVETLSDIVTSAGTQILTSWYNPIAERPSKSLLRWPKQKRPNQQAWNAWKQFLRSFENGTNRLRRPLGKWTKINQYRMHQAVIDEEGNLWLHQQNMLYNCHKKGNKEESTCPIFENHAYTWRKRQVTSSQQIY
jgi:hypothetical protein